jgi:hypothetical protein
MNFNIIKKEKCSDQGCDDVAVVRGEADRVPLQIERLQDRTG